MTARTFWFPKTTHLCESFSEWQERCVEFVEGNGDDTWCSVLFRLRMWAHSTPTNQNPNNNNNNNQQQQQQLIASPWSRAPPQIPSSSFLDSGDENDMIINNNNNNLQQQQQGLEALSSSSLENPGLIVRPIVWMVFAKTRTTKDDDSNNNNNDNNNDYSPYNLIHLSCAPADLANEIDHEKMSAVDLGQWHAKQMERFLQHTPSGRFPKSITFASDVAANKLPSSSNSTTSNDFDERCAKFAIQSLSLYFKTNPQNDDEKAMKEIELIHFSSIITEKDKNDEACENLLNSLHQNRQFVTTSLQIEGFVPMNLLPPDQSDPRLPSSNSNNTTNIIKDNIKDL